MNFPYIQAIVHFWYLFHMSKVTPGWKNITRGDFGHSQFLNFKRSLDIMSIVWICYPSVITIQPTEFKFQKSVPVKYRKFDHYLNHMFYVPFKRKHEKRAS